MEKELKIRLDRYSYNHILSLYKPSKTITQINSFFDTQDSYFRRQKTAFRIRNENEDQFFAALKHTVSITNGYSKADEIEQKLTESEYKALIALDTNAFISLLKTIVRAESDPADYTTQLFKGLDMGLVTGFKKTGEFKNIRKNVSMGVFTIELDKTFFTAERIEYELECETDEDRLSSLLDQLGIFLTHIEYMKKSKYERYLKHKGS
ncbi:CYTH domain-containing protein [Spirochaetota bacterium]